MQSNSHKEIASPKEVLSVYWSYVRAHPVYLTLILLGTVGLQGTMLAGPLLLRNFFNTLARSTPDSVVLASLTHTLVLLLGIYATEWVARRLQTWSNIKMSAQVMQKLYNDAFGYLLGHSHNFFISRFSGSLTHRLNKFARSFETLFDTIVISFIPTALFVLGATIILGTRNVMLGIALSVWIICFIAFQYWVSLRRQTLRVARAESETQATAVLADAIGNQQTISLFSGIAHEQEIFKTAIAKWYNATIRVWSSDELTWAGIGLFMIAIEIGLLYGAMCFWSVGLLTIGDFVLIQAYLLTTFDRLVGINRELRRFYDAFADAGEMITILQTRHEVRDRKNAKPLVVGKGEVWFDNVNFYFNKLRPVLKDFNLTIVGGERVALVGPSGAGKSTVTKLLLRLYDLPEGEIKIDKQDISKVTQETLRNAISFVPQEPILFHRTLMENIRYGRRDATDDEVIEAAKKAHCHEFISELQHGYDTYVGERGVKLSGGERQRVAIARAILKDAPILVLDEATSSLDSESEALIQDALETLMQGKTVIVIAHRLSTIMKMDRIVVMEGGKVVAQGTHLQLIKERGLYQKLWSIQAGGFIGGSEHDEDEPALSDMLEDEDLLAEEVEEK